MTLRVWHRAAPRIVCVLTVAWLLTMTWTAHAICVGDCDNSGAVTVDEVMLGVNQALEALPPEACTSSDSNGDRTVDIAEVTAAIGNALRGCPDPGDVAQSNVPRDSSPNIAADALANVVSGNTQFAFDLYHTVRRDGGNVFYSPYSISLALAMLYAGAANNTAQQMAQVLHFALPQTELHGALDALDLELSSRGRGRQGADGKGFRLNIANAVWGQKGYGFLSSYLDLLAANYGSGLRLLDFGINPDGSREIINGWVSERTEGRIPNLIGEGQITPFTRLVLTNAIYFNAAWARRFLIPSTRSEPFHLDGGGTAMVSMMHQVSNFPYTHAAGFQALELPYDGDELSMLVILPDPQRFDDVEAQLSPQLLANTVRTLSGREIDLAMPQFTYSTRYALAETLSALGMADAFNAGVADLSGIDGTRELSVDFVVHQAFVKVNEAGTEAAAATGIGVGVTSLPPPPIIVRMDRPFIFVIRDRPTGAILFLGRVVDPRG